MFEKMYQRERNSKSIRPKEGVKQMLYTIPLGPDHPVQDSMHPSV
jgi:hypothetical protein